MNKLITVAAACASMLVSSATLNPTICTNCGEGKVATTSECDVVVFKITGSGKANVTRGDYKTAKSLKIKKGALALTGTYCADAGTCCYETGMLYATVKIDGRTVKIAQEISLGTWSVYGKNLDKVRNVDMKRGKKYDLESALYVESEGDMTTDDDNIEDLTFTASAFGKVAAVLPKVAASASPCSPDTGYDACTPVYTPKSYSGWFAGKYSCVGEEDCFLCECTDADVFGGTWKAVYTSKAKTLAAARALADVDFDEDDDE